MRGKVVWLFYYLLPVKHSFSFSRAHSSPLIIEEGEKEHICFTPESREVISTPGLKKWLKCPHLRMGIPLPLLETWFPLPRSRRDTPFFSNLHPDLNDHIHGPTLVPTPPTPPFPPLHHTPDVTLHYTQPIPNPISKAPHSTTY